VSTLVIWEEVPETTKLFLIPDSEITPEIEGYLTLAHGRYTNSDDENEGLDFLNAAFTAEKHRVEQKALTKKEKDMGFTPMSDFYFKYQCRWAKFEIETETGEPINTTTDPVKRVVISGFIM